LPIETARPGTIYETGQGDLAADQPHGYFEAPVA
jgi:hypothetical protein